MLIIGLDREESEYMVRGLVMSFFPHQEFGVDLTPAGELSAEQKRERLHVEHNRVTYYDAEGNLVITSRYDQDRNPLPVEGQ